jgi:uncharacterized protein YciI
MCIQPWETPVHYLLFYDYAPDYMERRQMYRSEHLRLAWQSHARNELVLGGALEDPVDGGVLLFNGESPEVAQDFARSDPYVRNRLVTAWRVRPWRTVAGGDAASPVHP